MAQHIKLFEEFNDGTCPTDESKVKMCTKLCNECPFSKKSAPGWLADYTPQDLVDYQNHEGLFPCHMTMPERELDQEQVQAMLVQPGKLRLCRGYVESMIKSAKQPKHNQILKDAIEQVRKEGLSDESMPIWEFMQHHSKLK